MANFGNIFDRNDGFSREKFRKSLKRVRFKDKSDRSHDVFSGFVVASMGKFFHVCRDYDWENIVECNYGATLDLPHTGSSLITVGDYVNFVYSGDSKQDFLKGTIVKVEERTSRLSRKMVGLESEQVIAANADNLVIFLSAADPFYNKRLLDRFLISAELGNLNPVICINKVDISDENVIHEDLAIYKELNIPVILISAQTGRNFVKFENLLSDRVTVLAGPSGVGKSTAINRLAGDGIQAVREISDKTGKGQHTTSFSRMIKLKNGGLVIDTPGLREFGLWDIDRENLGFFFHDFDKYSRECRYLPCSHTHEPDCMVIKALEDELIDPERYESYVNILETLDE